MPWGVNIDGNDDVWVGNFWGRGVVLMAGDDTKGHPAGTKTGDVIHVFQSGSIQMITDVRLTRPATSGPRTTGTWSKARLGPAWPDFDQGRRDRVDRHLRGCVPREASADRKSAGLLRASAVRLRGPSVPTQAAGPGRLPINVSVQAFDHVEKPEFGADRELRAQVQFLFPK